MLIDKVEVRNGGVLICKTIWKTKKNIHKTKWHKSKKNSITSTNGEKWVQNMSKGKKG